MAKNVNVDNALVNTPYVCANDGASIPNVRFNLDKGKRFMIVWSNNANYFWTGGTFITLQYNNLKFPIGSRTRYNTYEDAYNVIKTWQALINNSTTEYDNYFASWYIVDTEIASFNRTGHFTIDLDFNCGISKVA